MKSFNVVIATNGRDTLQRMIDSIAPQLEKQDYFTIIWDCEPFQVEIKSPCTVIQIKNAEPLGYWGHGSRTKWQNILPGDFLMNADDDDIYENNVMQKIRDYCTEDKLYVFKMMNRNNSIVPSFNRIELGNIGTPCGVYMSGNLPSWGTSYGGDFNFYRELSKTKDVVFMDELIYIVKP